MARGRSNYSLYFVYRFILSFKSLRSGAGVPRLGRLASDGVGSWVRERTEDLTVKSLGCVKLLRHGVEKYFPQEVRVKVDDHVILFECVLVC